MAAMRSGTHVKLTRLCLSLHSVREAAEAAVEGGWRHLRHPDRVQERRAEVRAALHRLQVSTSGSWEDFRSQQERPVSSVKLC